MWKAGGGKGEVPKIQNAMPVRTEALWNMARRRAKKTAREEEGEPGRGSIGVVVGGEMDEAGRCASDWARDLELVHYARWGVAFSAVTQEETCIGSDA